MKPTITGFGIDNLPYGIFSLKKDSASNSVAAGNRRVGVAYLGNVLDLESLAYAGAFEGILNNQEIEVFSSPFLNDFMALGNQTWKLIRNKLQALLREKETPAVVLQAEHQLEDVLLHLPVKIRNYTDFYSSEYHATNVGAMFRPDNPLLPNWKHMPIAYHGRASSIVVSGTEVIRPIGQTKPANVETPVWGPTKQLDYELETAFVVGVPTVAGQRLTPEEAEEHIFGMVLFNDWSARDIQSWEYQPLGPFLAKNFLSSMSPWVVPMAALEESRLASPLQVPSVLPYLESSGNGHFDIDLEVWLEAEGQLKCIGKTNHKYLYWSQAQQLAHHTASGCPMEVGDLLASGTISGPTRDSLGCLLETTRRGAEPIDLGNGVSRTFLQDGDNVVMKGTALSGKISFGEVNGIVQPARP
jgi:fumarylacetoacetase